jgi:hypothetical protein
MISMVNRTCLDAFVQGITNRLLRLLSDVAIDGVIKPHAFPLPQELPSAVTRKLLKLWMVCVHSGPERVDNTVKHISFFDRPALSFLQRRFVENIVSGIQDTCSKITAKKLAQRTAM